ncbi:MAG: AMP-binding protein [Rhodospirillales bacterium 20-60-12]|nr:MAG: AMP-binding protein [Rhodospirillales bacterium 20-60-12]
MSTQSYVQGASSKALLGETIGAAFDRAAAKYATRDALIAPAQNISWTYAVLQREIDECAAGLIGLGLQPGERIGIWSPNNAQWTVLQFASAKAGLILVNINPAYRAHELGYALNKVGVAALVLAKSFKTSDYIALLGEVAVPSLRHKIVIADTAPPGMIRFCDIPRHANAAARQRLIALEAILQFDDPINIQFTSGTTGTPKGATLSHHNILNNGYFIGEANGITEADRICIPVPLYHCFGMVIGNLCAITHGAAMIYPAEGFDPLATLQAVQDQRCTQLYGVPTMFIAELDHPRFTEFDLTSLRGGVMAGSLCPIEIMKRVVEQMHMPNITICYGMTETSPVSLQSAIDDPIERRVTTVGRIHPHLEVKLIDAEGRIVPRNVKGEICTRGYSVMLGYWGEEAKTRETIDQAGWMHTGDLGVIDDEGYCTIVGRIKDLIIRGGENIYPREIEDFLFTHPKIASVAVLGVPDEKFGEAVCAWIKLADGQSATEDDIRDFCKSRIAHYKIPRYIKFVDDFPMTVTGKIQKFIMRDIMMAELSAAPAPQQI